jgi:single-strand DNA-binding protein
MNSVNIAGRLGADPELRNTNSGKPVCELRVAIDEGRDRTEWVSVVVWDQQATTANEHLRQGDFVTVTGRLQTRSWEQNGQKRYKTEVVAHRVGFGPKPQREPQQQRGGYDRGGRGGPANDLPF